MLFLNSFAIFYSVVEARVITSIQNRACGLYVFIFFLFSVAPYL